jgi:hypothetical protein
MFFINPVHKFMTYASIVIGAVAMIFSLTACSSEDEVSERYPLHEMVIGNQKDTNGTYFLIAAGIGSHKNAYYQFYVESPDKTISYHKNKASDVILALEPEGTKPFVKCTGKRRIIEPGERYLYDANMTQTYCVFHVPEGSIGSTVDIDLKKVQ